MKTISVLEKTRDYVIIKLPRKLFERIGIEKLSEDDALKILRSGMAEYRAGETKTLTSLRDLRYAD